LCGQLLAAAAVEAKGLDVTKQMSPADLSPERIDKSIAAESVRDEPPGKRGPQQMH
jgi:hypothetical protein